MTNIELNIKLREMAREQGLCDEWYSQWKDEDTIDDCLDRYVRGFDFAVKHDWPSLDFARKTFRPDELHRHNIYLDEEVDLEAADSGYYIFLGKCRGGMRIDGLKAVTVYLRHDSDMSIVALNGAKVFVTCWERSFGDCFADNYSTIKKYDKREKEV